MKAGPTREAIPGPLLSLVQDRLPLFPEAKLIAISACVVSSMESSTTDLL